jgi:ubiquitin carboxyl-terminal hydrolase 7
MKIRRTSALTAEGKPTEVKEFYDYLLNRINVTFFAKGSESVDPFTLLLSKRMTYDQLATKVGEHLNVEATHLRFSTINASTGRAKAPIRRNQVQSLGAILITPAYSLYGAAGNQRSDALYYEVLDMSLSELEQRKTIKLSWLPEGISKEVRMPGPVGDGRS